MSSASLSELGDFTELDGTSFARVSRDETWQACAQRVLWRSLGITICTVKLQQPGVPPAQRLFVHKFKSQKKVELAT